MYLHTVRDDDFRFVFRELQKALIEEEPVEVGEWQSQKENIPKMHELLNVSLHLEKIPDSQEQWADQTGAHLPWAEDHFQERVGGLPLNPPPSEAWWPFAQQGNKAHKSEGGAKFSHTYPERFWPKHAGQGKEAGPRVARHMGIRFPYGDLDDLIEILVMSPNTRQAYLPIWFPEDLEAAAGGSRVPCTLGYHFQIRNDELSINYYMRSCDLIRHFQDDVYMAGRLVQWIAGEVNTRVYPAASPREIELKPGEFHMHIANLHVFEGDIDMMEYRDKKGLAWSID